VHIGKIFMGVDQGPNCCKQLRAFSFSSLLEQSGQLHHPDTAFTARGVGVTGKRKTRQADDALGV